MKLSLDQTHPSHLSTFPQFEQHQSKIDLNNWDLQEKGRELSDIYLLDHKSFF